jgi:hypothetical protein
LDGARDRSHALHRRASRGGAFAARADLLTTANRAVATDGRRLRFEQALERCN